MPARTPQQLLGHHATTTQALPTNARMDAVRAAFNHSWEGYAKFAWGCNELRPTSRDGESCPGSGGLGLTILDSLSTMHVMGLNTSFMRARDWLLRIALPVH